MFKEDKVYLVIKEAMGNKPWSKGGIRQAKRRKKTIMALGNHINKDTVCSAVRLILKTWICSNLIHILGSNLSIMQILDLLMLDRSRYLHVFLKDKGTRVGFLNWQRNPWKTHSDNVLLRSVCSIRQTRGLYQVSRQAHLSFTCTSYFASSNNCSAFNKRTTIIKIAIIKKVIYIINFLWVYYSGIFCTWPRTKFPMYTEPGGWGGSVDLGSLSLMPWKTRFLSSLESCSPPCCSEVATFCKPGGAGERAGDRRAGAFPSVSSHSLSIHKAHQQLLFLNSPFSVMESLVGLVGEMPLRTCMLYRSFTWVSALISLVLAESSDTIDHPHSTATPHFLFLNSSITLTLLLCVFDSKT